MGSAYVCWNFNLQLSRFSAHGKFLFQLLIANIVYYLKRNNLYTLMQLRITTLVLSMSGVLNNVNGTSHALQFNSRA